jgi:hypothetical protein
MHNLEFERDQGDGTRDKTFRHTLLCEVGELRRLALQFAPL